MGSLNSPVSAMQDANSTLDSEARQLLDTLANSCNDTYGFGSFTVSIYDTAWVSLVAKEIDGHPCWLFPTTFTYLLERQSSDGSWDSDRSEIDGILNTLAALLSLENHRALPPLSEGREAGDLDDRISRATSFLRHALQDWNVNASKHVSFEILVLGLLGKLEEFGVRFEFGERECLVAIRNRKMAKFDPLALYGSSVSTALHSLEALTGRVDFDRMRHRKVFGSMMASPASTSAYLMNISVWDDEAEAYLRHVISAGMGKNSGGVPSAFPTTLFEITWVVSTLLESGFSQEVLGVDRLTKLVHIVGRAFDAEEGLIGFAPFVGSDADDTAKAITTLLLVGRSPSPDRMVRKYEAKTHFKTYTTERDASFSTNCNVLKALLHVKPRPSQWLRQIGKLVSFICDQWWETNGSIEDKWNLSPFYPTMLIAQALMQVLKMWDQGTLEIKSEQLVPDRVFVALFQAAVRILRIQNADGSWGKIHSREETAYASLALAELACLPPLLPLNSEVKEAIRRGREFLAKESSTANSPDYLWIEKVTYGLSTIPRGYVLAARNIPMSDYYFGDRLKQLCAVPIGKVAHSTKFLTKLLLFAQSPKWKVESALIESYLYLPQLKRVQFDVFPGQDWDKFKYFDYIPFSWIGPNYINTTPLGPALQFDMMVFSLLVYQADEYMEALIGPKFAGRLSVVKDIIESIFDNLDGDHQSNGSVRICDGEPPKKRRNLGGGRSKCNGYADSEPYEVNLENGRRDSAEVKSTLRGFIDFFLKHPGIKSAQEAQIQQLHYEMKTFLVAHVTQLEDNERLSKQEDIHGGDSGSVFESPRSSFFYWVHHTSSDHTSCPFAFAFLTCQISQGKETFETAEGKYYAHAICSHLAIMCRMYNDHGSLKRDREEANLNSINFPEFGSRESRGSDQDLKDRLFRLASYERKCLELAQSELEKVANPIIMRTVRTFCDVTDMYGQMYMLKDLTHKIVSGDGVIKRKSVDGEDDQYRVFPVETGQPAGPSVLKPSIQSSS